MFSEENSWLEYQIKDVERLVNISWNSITLGVMFLSLIYLPTLLIMMCVDLNKYQTYDLVLQKKINKRFYKSKYNKDLKKDLKMENL